MCCQMIFSRWWEKENLRIGMQSGDLGMVARISKAFLICRDFRKLRFLRAGLQELPLKLFSICRDFDWLPLILFQFAETPGVGGQMPQSRMSSLRSSRRWDGRHLDNLPASDGVSFSFEISLTNNLIVFSAREKRDCQSNAAVPPENLHQVPLLWFTFHLTLKTSSWWY